jgi:hypothetical protein
MTPERNTYNYHIYVELCLAMRLRRGGYLNEGRRKMIARIADECRVTRSRVVDVYDRTIRRKLRDGVKIEDLK